MMARFDQNRKAEVSRANLRTLAKRILRVQFPIIPGLHHLLLAERRFRKGLLRHLFAKIYYEPLLRMQCRRVERGLILYEDMPKLMGSLEIEIGRSVVLAGSQVWIGAGDRTPKRLLLGDFTYIGHGTELVVGSEIRIGSHVQLANRVLLNGYDGHALDPLERARGDGPPPAGRRPIVVEDYAWLGNDVTVLRGVTIGRGAVVASASVVTRDVPELTVVAGNPARVVREIERPSSWNN